METSPQILCVDDDPHALEGLELALRGLGEVHTAGSGSAAVGAAARLPRLALVVCDLRMPGRDGALVLADFVRLHPDASRILLTGHAAVDAAIAAVNEAQAFRFLTKPCAPDALREACRAGLRRHELLRAERELLDQTLKGCIDALTDALAIASPAVFGHAQRVRSLARATAERLHGHSDWALEVAAMLLHLGLVGLPEALLDQLLRGVPLEPRQKVLVAAGCRHAMHTLQGIPKLGPVRDVIRLTEPTSGGNLEWQSAQEATIRDWAAVLRAARAYVRLESCGFAPAAAVTKLGEDVPPAVLDALAVVVGSDSRHGVVREVGLAALEAGMVLARPLHAASGQLLAPAGYEIRPGFARRFAELRPDLRGMVFSVIVPPDQHAAPPVEIDDDE